MFLLCQLIVKNRILELIALVYKEGSDYFCFLLLEFTNVNWTFVKYIFPNNLMFCSYPCFTLLIMVYHCVNISFDVTVYIRRIYSLSYKNVLFAAVYGRFRRKVYKRENVMSKIELPPLFLYFTHRLHRYLPSKIQKCHH